MTIKYPGKMLSSGTVLLSVYWICMFFLATNLYMELNHDTGSREYTQESAAVRVDS